LGGLTFCGLLGFAFGGPINLCPTAVVSFTI
jgi:hypothetical protein